MVERVDLLEHPGPGVAGHLVDDLDRVLLVGPVVPTSPDRGISSLAQDLAGQTVQILEGRGHDGGGVGLLLLPPSGFGLFLALLKGHGLRIRRGRGQQLQGVVARGLGRFLEIFIPADDFGGCFTWKKRRKFL